MLPAVRVLVTGGSGLVGREVVAALVSQGDEVVALGRQRPEGVSAFVEADLAQPVEEDRIPAFDAVVHLARSNRFRDFPAAAPETLMVDVAAAIALAELAVRRGAPSFVYASSGAAAEAGEPEAGSPELAFYAAAKRSGELLLGAFSAAMSIAALRLFFPFSAHRPCFVRSLALGISQGEPVRLNGPEGLRLNPVAAEDAGAAVVAALSIPGRHDVAGPEAVTLRELALRLGRRLGAEPSFADDRAVRGRELLGRPEDLSDLLGRPPTQLDEALDRLVRGLAAP